MKTYPSLDQSKSALASTMLQCLGWQSTRSAFALALFCGNISQEDAENA